MGIKGILRGIQNNSRMISQKTGKSSFLIKLDMISCIVKYKASPNNYEEFEFYKLNAKQRKTYVTYGINKKMIKAFNKREDFYLLENKFVFAEKFTKYMKRKYLSTERMSFEDFKSFCEGQEKIICKPTDSAGDMA